ncbi:MAG: phenylalanine--tRNA ligase subunit beta, partial [Wenzhouxiangellaceae bacterium]
ELGADYVEWPEFRLLLVYLRQYFELDVAYNRLDSSDDRRLSLPETAQPLANPLSRELGVLRTSLLPGLLRTAASNLRHQLGRLKLYETGHVFHAGDSWDEQQRLGLVLAGAATPESWHQRSRPFDFFDLKGELEQLLAVVGHSVAAVSVAAESRPWLHPGQAARIELAGAEDALLLGHAGQLHPAIAAEMEFETPVFVAELALEPLRARGLPEYTGVSRFPAVRRDLALIVPETVQSADLRWVAAKVAGSLLERCIIFDVYQGKNIDEGCKSIAMGLILRELSRTLTDGEVDSLIQKVVESLKQECHARLRGSSNGANEGGSGEFTV